MRFFQRITNALSRFMYGRNGGDQLGLAMIWTAILLDIISIFLKQKTAVYVALSFVSTVLIVIALFRMLSRNLQKRRAENAKFLNAVWNPVKRRIDGARQQRQDKEHKYFTCTCGAVCRVPRGKGKIVITCPKCGAQIHGRS